MGKSMYNFGKQGKEKAKQQKQMDKAAKRIMAKQQKANLKTGTPNADSAIAEPKLAEGVVKNTANGQDEPGSPKHKLRSINMDFETILKNRRAIRDFQNKEVPLSILKEIIQDTCLAPTASNGQPCRFIIIQNRDYIKKLSDESKKNLLSDLEKNPESPLKNYESKLRDEKANVFYNAPCLVFFIGPKEVHSLDVDSGLTVAYFMFSATSRGLGTCWIGLGAHIRDRKILADIGVPRDCRIVAPIIVGYPNSIPAASERHSPDILKVV